MKKENRNLPPADKSFEKGQEFMYSLLRSQYPEEAGLALEYFQNDGFLSGSEIADIEGKGKINNGVVRASLNEKVKGITGRSFLEQKEVKMVSAIMAVLPAYMGLSATSDKGFSLKK